MHIKWIGIRHLPPLDEVSFGCDERVNLLIGPNASGKSNILRGLRSAYLGEMHRAFEILTKSSDLLFLHHSDKNPIDMDTATSIYVDLSIDWPRDSDGDIETQWDTVPLLYIPATRASLPGVHIFNRTINKDDAFESDAPLKDVFDTGSGIFYGQYVELAIDWLRERMTVNRSQQSQLRKALSLGYSCSKSICYEVIHDDVPHPYVELDDDHENSDTGRIVHHDMGIRTTDAEYSGEPLYAGALSSGTQGTLLWVWALALKIASHYDWEDGWESKPAILLIDEIENHLHPTWQRRVIPALLEHFPGLQIFATTHSPFVVAGLKAGQVHLLKRDENGVVTASTNTEDVIGWTADEILRTMMDVEDPTDAETAAAAHELRQLRKEGSRSAPEAEERRQERIQELRQRVDRDLLAGGPLARQREIFEQQFAEALRKYRQSKNLNQENG